MGKNNRHVKNVKSERAKVKLKAKKLPKGQNEVKPSFKVKKILIKEQLKSHEKSEILSKRKLNVKDLLSRLQHHNSSVRQEAIKELKEIIQHYPMEILSVHLNALLQGISALTLDRERDIRRDSLKVLNSILVSISKEQLAPFADILVSYLCCAMTHINPNIKEDSLDYLDILVQNTSNLVAKYSEKILPNILDMISKHHSKSQTSRHLVVTLNSKSTSVKWRIRVLGTLANILTSIISSAKAQKNNNSHTTQNKILFTDDVKFHIPLYYGNYLDRCKINFDEDITQLKQSKKNEEIEEFNKYIQVLVPLMLESWLEVKPNKNPRTDEIPLISLEGANLLKTISMVMQLIVEYIEVLEPPSSPARNAFSKNFQNIFAKYLLNEFPYHHASGMERFKKRQEDFDTNEENSNSNNNNCLEQNLTLCYVYMWMIAESRSKKICDPKINEICERILEFVKYKLDSWSDSMMSAFPQLIKLLRVILLRCCMVLYRSGFSLGGILRSLIVASSRQSRQDLHAQWFSILSDIILDHNLRELHDEDAFKNFVRSLPDLLMKSYIHETTIKTFNRVILQYGRWIREELVQKQSQILENAKTIQIIGTTDEKQSRLMICNLFHFVDGQIYF